MPILLGALASAVRKRFYDNFAGRTNTTGGLGTATDGSQWTAVNGTIQVTSGAATATATPTSGGAGTTYPMAVVNMPTQNNVISISGAGTGSSAAIWVQSSSDWWTVDLDETFNTIPGNTSYAYAWNAGTTNWSTAWNAGTSNFTNAYSVAPTQNATNYSSTQYYTIGSGYTVAYAWQYTGPSSWSYKTNYYSGTAWTVYTGYTSSAGTWNAGTTYNYASGNNSTSYTYASGNNSTQYNYSYVNATTYAYSQILRLSQSIASTVNSAIASVILTTSSATKAVAMKIFTSGTTITARAYTDNNFVSQLGSDLVYTATGATITTQYGIAISPSAYNQSAIIGTLVDISRN